MANANQTSANNPKDLYVSLDGGSKMKYSGDMLFTTTNNGASQYQSTARVVAQGGALYFQNDNAINFSLPLTATPRIQINPDATGTNQLSGLYVSTTGAFDAGIQTNGYSGTAQLIQQKDGNNNPVNQWSLFTAKTSAGGVQPSTLQMFNYAAKDNFQFNSLTSPVFTINPNLPRIDIPTYSVNAASLLVSSINGGLPPAANTVIDIPQIVPANAAYLQQTTSAAVVSNSGIVAGGIYQYDLSVVLDSAVANNVGSAPTYPYNILFGVRLGGNGAFNWTHTTALQSAGGLGVFGDNFNLCGTATAGTTNSNIEILIYHGQPGTTVSLTFSTPADPTMTLQRIQ